MTDDAFHRNRASHPHLSFLVARGIANFALQCATRVAHRFAYKHVLVLHCAICTDIAHGAELIITAMLNCRAASLRLRQNAELFLLRRCLPHSSMSHLCGASLCLLV
jgi:hypothetical protein